MKKIFLTTVRFTEPERAWIEAEADRRGTSLGETVRLAVQRCQAQEAEAARLAAMETRLAALIRTIPQQTAQLLVPDEGEQK